MKTSINLELSFYQFIQQAIRRDFSNIDEILTPPDGQDEGVWKYEHLRQFCMELNGLAVKLQVMTDSSPLDRLFQTRLLIFTSKILIK